MEAYEKGAGEGVGTTEQRAASHPPSTPSHPPAIPPPGAYAARIVGVWGPIRRWRRQTFVRLSFQLEQESQPLIHKWVAVDYTHLGSALRRICALLVGSPNANFRALKGRRCMVEIAHMPGKKHPVFALVTKVGLPDESLRVPLGYGFSEEQLLSSEPPRSDA